MINKIVFCVLLVVGGLVIGYTYRGQATEREVAQYREREADMLAQLAEKDKQREVVYRDRIKVVEKTAGECVDAPIPDDVLRVLPGGGQAKRGADKRL